MNRISLSVLMAGMLLLLGAAPAAWAADQRFSLSSEFDNSTDKYEAGPWMFRLTQPVGLYGQNDAYPLNTQTGMAGKTQSGLGNSAAAVSYNLYEGSASSPEVNLTGTVKVNGTDEGSSFGLTGNDYAAQMDVYQNMDRFTARGSLGSRMVSGPTGITISPLLYGSFGGIYQFSENTSTGIDMSLSQGSPASGMTEQGLSAFVNYKLDSNLKARGYVFRGISSGAPRNTVGGQVYYGF
ncbi:MAG: hypothetical protein WCB93_03525 [Gallionella sp.]